LLENRPKKRPKPHKTAKNRKKPVETKEIRLTKPSEKTKVKCGTVLRTRMNIDVSHDAPFAEQMSTGAGERTDSQHTLGK
jgi:hypothetical protein